MEFLFYIFLFCLYKILGNLEYLWKKIIEKIKNNYFLRKCKKLGLKNNY